MLMRRATETSALTCLDVVFTPPSSLSNPPQLLSKGTGNESSVIRVGSLVHQLTQPSPLAWPFLW